MSYYQETQAVKDAKANFLMANEYMDFIEFLQNELGFEEVRELQKKFDQTQE